MEKNKKNSPLPKKINETKQNKKKTIGLKKTPI